MKWVNTLQTLHVCSTLKRRGNKCFHFVSTWNTCGVFVGYFVTYTIYLVDMQKSSTAWIMPEYGFSLTRMFPLKDILEYMGKYELKQARIEQKKYLSTKKWSFSLKIFTDFLKFLLRTSISFHFGSQNFSNHIRGWIQEPLVISRKVD